MRIFIIITLFGIALCSDPVIDLLLDHVFSRGYCLLPCRIHSEPTPGSREHPTIFLQEDNSKDHNSPQSKSVRPAESVLDESYLSLDPPDPYTTSEVRVKDYKFIFSNFNLSL